MLDLLANRCLASGTNAWTDTDHTCYTMTNAGSEGFLNLLPIYLEHILYPTLTVRQIQKLVLDPINILCVSLFRNFIPSFENSVDPDQPASNEAN